MSYQTLLGLTLPLGFLLGCSDPAVPPLPPVDAGTDAPIAVVCAVASDCDDGLFCNGAERCLPSDTHADVHGCVDALADACAATDGCDETADVCLDACAVPDADGDGVDSIACGGTDCDDDDANRFPGNTEVCDASHDEDCDDATLGPDADGDTYVDAACCNLLADTTLLCGTDCDDSAIGVNPGSPEACNGIDDDCDTLVDEGVLSTWYRDVDGDGFGAAASGTMDGCLMPTGYVALGTDCNDANAAIHPGAVEICDALLVDEDCSGTGNDRTPACDCIDGATSNCLELGVCSTYLRTCADGHWGACPHAPTPETCPPNGLDDNCNGFVDEGITRITCYVDADLDGYPSPDDSRTQLACASCPSGWTSRPPTGANLDCADFAANVHPGASAQTTAYCVDPANSLCLQAATWTCIAPASGCPSTSLGAASFDYDCDGSETHVGGCMNCGGTCACH